MSNYLGFEPTDSPEYWFVSYNNEDAERVSGLACAINNAGIPLWYDYGIEYGEKWAWQINEKIAGAQGMILLLTRGILQKENSYVQKEYRIATEADKKIVVLMVDEITKQDVPVRKLDWWVDIREKQCLEICRLDRQDKALDEIRRALNLPAGEKTGEMPAPQPAEETQEKEMAGAGAPAVRRGPDRDRRVADLFSRKGHAGPLRYSGFPGLPGGLHIPGRGHDGRG